MRKLAILASLLTLGFFAGQATATEYIYRDLMANTLPSARCDKESTARETASKAITLDKYSKKFCQTQGYGWHVDEIKTAGNTVCESCGNQAELKKCHQEDLVVSCKRIKPGSVGMLPGKS